MLTSEAAPASNSSGVAVQLIAQDLLRVRVLVFACSLFSSFFYICQRFFQQIARAALGKKNAPVGLGEA
jgi:hypothetical protein